MKTRSASAKKTKSARKAKSAKKRKATRKVTSARTRAATKTRSAKGKAARRTRPSGKTTTRSMLSGKSGAGNPTARGILDGSLDPTATLPVVIRTRQQPAGNGNQINWRRKPGALNFDFSDFQGATPPFYNVQVAKNWIELDFNYNPADPPGSEYAYTITVEYGGASYVSDEAYLPRPTDGRAVIRN